METKKENLINGELTKGNDFKNILPKTEISLEDAKDFTKSLLSDMSEGKMKIDGSKTEVKNIPSANGKWDGEPGNSKWIPNDDYVHPNKDTNPERKTWGEIKEKYSFDGISFKEGEPNFSEVSMGTVKIDSFSEKRQKNFSQADKVLAEQQKNSPEEIKKFRKENKLTWHERSDMRTMDLVPSEIHGGITHSGGIAKIKALKNEGGESNGK